MHAQFSEASAISASLKEVRKYNHIIAHLGRVALLYTIIYAYSYIHIHVYLMLPYAYEYFKYAIVFLIR